MRSLLLFVVLLNVALYLWSVRQENTAAPAISTTEPNIPPLVLLSERPSLIKAAQQNKTNTPEEQVVENPEETKSKQALCYTIGPFMDDLSAAEISGSLRKSGLEVARRNSEKKEEIGYWVYLPPVEGYTKAKAITQELSKKGIKEFYIVQPGDELASAISLGVFREKSYAVRHYKRVTKLGFKPILSTRYRENPIYWLDIVDTEGSGNLPNDWQKGLVGVQRFDRLCDETAAAD